MNKSFLIVNYLKRYKKLFSNEIFLPQSDISKNTQSLPSKENDALIPYECIINGCKECKFNDTRSNYFFGSGDPCANLLIVDENPALERNHEGLLFLGKAGKLLDKILLAIGLSRTQNVFIVNILKCRPPNNRDPLPSEIEKYIPYMKRQINIIKPKLILALGKVAGKSLVEKEISLQKMRDTIFDYNGVPLKITYHPESLIKNQNLKKFAWDDFKWVKKYMG